MRKPIIRSDSERKMDTWSVCGIHFRMKKGTPLSKVLERGKKTFEKETQAKMVGAAARVWVPRCSPQVKPREYTKRGYTVWQWKEKSGTVIVEIHLRRATEYMTYWWYPTSSGKVCRKTQVQKWEIV